MKRTPVLVTALAIAALVAAPAVAAAPSVTLKPAAIDRGADVSGPHVVGSTIRDGDTRVTLDRANVSLIGTSGTAYVVAVSRKDGSGARTLRVRPDGSTRTLTKGDAAYSARLSDDGAALLSSPYVSAKRTVIRVVDARTGELVRKRTFPGSATVLDADAGRAVIGRWRPDRTFWWDYTTDRTTRINNRVGYTADIAAGRLASLTGDPYQGGCSVVTDLAARPTTLWRSCEERADAFSPDGSRVATVHILSDGIGPSGVAVRRTDGGKKLAAYDVKGWFGRLHWESDTALLLDTYGQKKWATVRCEVGSCERASSLRPTPDY